MEKTIEIIAVIKRKEFVTAIGDMKAIRYKRNVIGDMGSVWIDKKEDKILFSANGDVTSYEAEVNANMNKLAEKDIKTMYPISYLDKILKSNYKDITIEFSKEYPMILLMNDEYTNLKFVVAPRIE